MKLVKAHTNFEAQPAFEQVLLYTDLLLFGINEKFSVFGRRQAGNNSNQCCGRFFMKLYLMDLWTVLFFHWKHAGITKAYFEGLLLTLVHLLNQIIGLLIKIQAWIYMKWRHNDRYLNLAAKIMWSCYVGNKKMFWQ